MIRYLSNNAIDKEKWDECIAGSALPLPYPESWYLDIVNPNWEALILDDYNAVMPLPVQKKFGIQYLAQPYFSQQLGIFGREINKEITEEFLKAIPSKFRLIDISLNTINIIDPSIGEQQIFINQELKLDKKYQEIFNDFSTNHQRNIKKGRKNNLNIKKGISPEVHLQLMLDHLPHKLSQFVKDYKRLQLQIINTAISKNKGFLVGVVDENGNLCGSVFFLKAFRRLIYLFSVTTDDGKGMGAMHFLIDEIVKEYEGTDLILDFEGSNIPPIYKFYKGFGAEENKYVQLKINNLPWLLKLIKR